VAADLTLTPEAAADLEAIRRYFSSFVSILMSSIWIKVLPAIDDRNKILQSRSITVDIEVSNLRDLLDDLQSIRGNPGSTAVLGEDRVTISGRSQYGILGGHWDVTFCNPGVTPVMDI
jgi:hypothetical protein